MRRVPLSSEILHISSKSFLLEGRKHYSKPWSCPRPLWAFLRNTQALFFLGPPLLLPARVCHLATPPFFPHPSFLGPQVPDCSASLSRVFPPWKEPLQNKCVFLCVHVCVNVCVSSNFG